MQRYGIEQIYSITDYSYQTSGDSVYWGIINFNDYISKYDEAGTAFFEHELSARMCRIDAGYNVPTYVCLYPGDTNLVDDTTKGLYLPGQNKFHIADDQYYSISHEFGHHIHVNKGVVVTPYWYKDFVIR